MKISQKLKKLLSVTVSVVIAFSMGMTSFAVGGPGETLTAPKVLMNDEVYDTLKEAVNAAESGATITLGEGKYTLYGEGADTKGKDLTFIYSGSVVKTKI